MFKIFRFVFIGLALTCSWTAQLNAKVVAGVSGTVTDSSGAVLVGATVQMKSTETGAVETRQSNSEGFYAFVNLVPGHYDLEVRQSGFTTFRQTGIVLDVDSAKILNVAMKLGQVSEQVVVSGESVQIDTASTQTGEVITERTIAAVPLVTRSYTDLLALQPGVAPTTSGLAGSQGGQFSATGFTFNNVSGDLNAGNLSVNGQRESANGFLLNGTTVQEFAFSGTAIIPNLDSIAEFRIVTNNFDAEYGNYPGGQVNVITKTGANRLHGSGFEFLRNKAFDATRYFAATKDDHKQNQFGGTIGGPIKKDKLFFFADYQGNRVVIGQSGNFGSIAVPTTAERSGDFSADGSSFASGLTASPQNLPVASLVKGNNWASELAARLGYSVNAGEPYYYTASTINPATIDPTTGVGTPYGVDCTTSNATTGCVFPGAQIPQSALTEPSTNLLQFVPPGNAGDGQFLPTAAPIRLNDDKTSGRLDFNSHLGQISGYYFFDQYRQSVPNAFLPGFGSDFTGRSQVVNLGDSKTLGGASVNELRFGFTRIRYLIHKPTGGNDVTPASLGFEEGPNTLGISPSLPQYAHVPNIHFSTFSFGASGGALGVTETTYQVMDNFSRVIKTHTLTFGGQFRYNQLTEYNGGSNGDFEFHNGGDGETGLEFADFLIGAPARYSQGQGYPSYGLSRYIGLFAQDSWRIKPNLTLNYGMRWDVSRPWSEKNGQLETLLLGLNSTRFPGSPTGWVFPGDPGIPSTLAPTRWNNFAPRFGLAYSPNSDRGFLKALTGGSGKTSIRVGWGKFYSTFEGATNFNEIGDAPFGAFYGSPVPPEFVTPFIDRGTGNIEGQRFPVPLPDKNTPINWANFLPIGTSPAFYYKNVLPYTEEYQLSIARQLSTGTLLTVSYVGTQGHHLLSSLQANPGNPALCLSVDDPTEVTDNNVCGPGGENGVYHPITGGTINSTRGPFGANFSSDGYFITNGQSSYNSFQLSLRQRISRLEFLAGYTYGKSLDNGSGYGEQINFLDPNQKSLSSFDVRHNFVVSYDYRLPFDLLPGPSRLVKGWRLSGITRFSTGQPVTLVETDDNSLLGTSGAGAISLPIDTPNYTPGSLNISDPRSGQPYFNSALFTPELKGTLGNARRRFFAGPGLNNWDIALLKDTMIKEGINAEFRAELFNAFNHAQFLSPDGNVNSSSFGLVTNANPPRIMQLSLKLLF